MYGIFGAGGHGREVMPLLLEAHRPVTNFHEFVFVVADGSTERSCNGSPVITESEFFARSDLRFNVAIADPKTREKIVNYVGDRAQPIPIVASTFVGLFQRTHDDHCLAPLLSHFTQIGPNTKIGRFLHLNNHASISHDCEAGDFVTVSPGARVNGRTKIGNRVFIGANATIRDGGITIGDDAVIGMGAVVLRDVPAGATVVGNPAQVIARR